MYAAAVRGEQILRSEVRDSVLGNDSGFPCTLLLTTVRAKLDLWRRSVGVAVAWAFSSCGLQGRGTTSTSLLRLGVRFGDPYTEMGVLDRHYSHHAAGRKRCF